MYLVPQGFSFLFEVPLKIMQIPCKIFIFTDKVYFISTTRLVNLHCFSFLYTEKLNVLLLNAFPLVPSCILNIKMLIMPKRNVYLFRCEDYAISLLEQCEDLREVETFLQTRSCDTKDSNYILAILDSRMKFVAHERFQYVMLKKFGKYFKNI